jgi:hypothetical protein
MAITKAEQETIIRYDQEKRVLHLYTAYAADARRWARLGYTVEVCDRTRAGTPRGWQAQAPFEAVRLRKLVDGQVVMRRRGRSFGFETRKLAGAEERSVAHRTSASETIESSKGCKLAGGHDHVN